MICVHRSVCILWYYSQTTLFFAAKSVFFFYLCKFSAFFPPKKLLRTHPGHLSCHIALFFFQPFQVGLFMCTKQKSAKFVLLRLQRTCKFILLSKVTKEELTVPASVFVCSGVFLGIQRMCSCVFVSVDWKYCRRILLWGRPGFEKPNESHRQWSYLCMEGWSFKRNRLINNFLWHLRQTNPGSTNIPKYLLFFLSGR